jgi:quercetin dioxygenase-like cupin family protein
MVVHCELLPETSIPEHVHKVEQFTTCLTGRVEVRLAGRTVVLAPGRAVRIPPAVPHAVRVLDPAGAETLNVFEPETGTGAPPPATPPPRDPAPLR